MLKRFIEFIEEHQLCTQNSKLYIALSGGVDSIVLTHLAMQANFDLHVLHANFQLRGRESDEDAKFVEKFCKKYNLPCTIRIFPLNALSRNSNINIQDTARKMRYTWFKEMLDQNPGARVATAHHHDDNIETVLLNILRVTGVKGLSGIPLRRGNIIRPLLFVGKNEILQYAEDKKLPFREDSSNTQMHYFRNRIRKQLIPVFRKMHPHFDELMEKNIRIWNETSNWVASIVTDHLKKFVRTDGSFHRIDLNALLETDYPTFLLFEILSPYGFGRDQIGRLYKAILDERVGARFQSKRFELLVDREELIIRNRKEAIRPSYVKIEALGTYFYNSGILILEEVSTFDKSKASSTEVFFDGGNLHFPLIIRIWKPGDSFQPFGMGGRHQKVKKYLTDKKIDRFEKEHTLVLCSGNKICWVVGHRIDHRFRVTKNTRSIVRCTWSKRE